MAEQTSLFGPSAQEARRASDLDFETRTRTQAQLDPMALNYASRVNAGRSIGQGINSLFGGQSTDPELRRAEIMDSIFKTLSPEELKNPAKALSTIADALEEQGLPRDAAEARMKSTTIAQQMSANENKVISDNIKTNQFKLENIAQAANSALTVFQNAPDSLEMQEAVYNKFVDVQERLFGTEAADKLRTVKPSERKVVLESAIDAADKEATRAKKDIADARIASVQKLAEFKAGVSNAQLTLKENNKFIYQANDLKYKASAAYLENLGDRISATDDSLKQQADLLAMYSDPMKTPTLSESERVIAVNQITDNMKTLEHTKGQLYGMQTRAGKAIQSPSLVGPGSLPTTSTGATGRASPTGTKTEYEADYINAQAALQRPGANKQAILNAFKAKHSDQPQPTAATVTPTPGTTPVANPAAPAAVVPPKPQTEAERREQIFLDRLNDRTPLEVIQDVGSSIAGGIRSGEKYFQDKADTFNKNIDIAASVAKEKLKDKTFVSKLSERQLKHLNEIANDSGAKHRIIQQSQTPFELPFVASSYVAATTVPAALKVASRIAVAKAIKEAIRTPSDIEKSMTGLQDRLKRVEELERARKLKQLGESDKVVLAQIKEEVKLMDQANETALTSSLKNAENAASRKVAMEQRKRLADIRKEIKRVFSIAGGTPVSYTKPEFN
jgi:hypothetical protein